MAENEIITQQAPQMQMFAQLMEGILKKLERYCATARPMLGGEVYLSGEEVCSQLRLSTRTLQEYRNLGTCVERYLVNVLVLFVASVRVNVVTPLSLQSPLLTKMVAPLRLSIRWFLCMMPMVNFYAQKV